MSRKLVILLRLAFYITYFLNIKFDFLVGQSLYVFNIVVFIIFIFNVIESYKELRLEKNNKIKAKDH